MFIFFIFILAFFLGYLYGYWVKPNRRLRETIQEVKRNCVAVLEEGRKGVYKTIVMDKDKSSELVVEVQELAVTELGQVKVKYLSAYYKNPDFRTKKGEALLQEVHGLLGEYLPLQEIEWFETTERHEHIKRHIQSIENSNKKRFSI